MIENKIIDLFKNKKVMLSYHTNSYDGIIGGYCWYRGKYCAFDQIEERDFRYKLKSKEIEEAKLEFKKLNLEWEERDGWEYTSYRIYAVYNFKTDLDAIKALAGRAIWEDFVGFQNSYCGDATKPRVNKEGRHYEEDSKNDYCFSDTIGDPDIKKYFDDIPYRKGFEPKIDKTKELIRFELYNNTKELKKEGYTLEPRND